MNSDAFDVPDPQGPPSMNESTLDDGGVADQLVAVPGDGVHPADGVFPIVIGHLAGEDDFEELAGSGAHRTMHVGSVPDLDRELSLGTGHGSDANQRG
jgi:hypothetical protein